MTDRLAHVRDLIGRAIDWQRRAEWAHAGMGARTESMCDAGAERLLDAAWGAMNHLDGDDVAALKAVIRELRNDE